MGESEEFEELFGDWREGYTVEGREEVIWDMCMLEIRIIGECINEILNTQQQKSH